MIINISDSSLVSAPLPELPLEFSGRFLISTSAAFSSFPDDQDDDVDYVEEEDGNDDHDDDDVEDDDDNDDLFLLLLPFSVSGLPQKPFHLRKHNDKKPSV